MTGGVTCGKDNSGKNSCTRQATSVEFMPDATNATLDHWELANTGASLSKQRSSHNALSLPIHYIC